MLFRFMIGKVSSKFSGDIGRELEGFEAKTPFEKLTTE